MNEADNHEIMKKRGRPRSERSRQAVLDATLALVEEYGCGAVTMGAIAKKAGVGKQTLYKWWGGTGEIFIEVLRNHAEREIVLSEAPSGESLGCFLGSTFQALKPTIRLILKALMAKAIVDEGFRERFISEIISNRRGVLQQVLERSSGLVISDPALLVDFIFGLMWYRLLLDVGPLDREEGERIARVLREGGRTGDSRGI